jgi:hypothetical protein
MSNLPDKYLEHLDRIKPDIVRNVLARELELFIDAMDEAAQNMNQEANWFLVRDVLRASIREAKEALR